MAAVVVKNTFWEIVVEEPESLQEGARRRARSAEPLDQRAQAEGEAPGHIAEQACRLCALLGARPHGGCADGAPARAAQAGHGARGKGPELKPLRSVVSSSSLSTMLPQEGDSSQDEDERLAASHSRSRHGQAGRGGRPRPRPTSNASTFLHGSVPKRQNFTASSPARIGAAPTTMMLRNIPNRYTQKELMSEIEHLGFFGMFDFFYSPMDTGSMGNVGYAFINFVNGVQAQRFLDMMPGHVFYKHQQRTRTKVATVSVAHLQGLEANLRHYESSAVNSRGRSRRPVVMTHLECAIAQVVG